MYARTLILVSLFFPASTFAEDRQLVVLFDLESDITKVDERTARALTDHIEALVSRNGFKTARVNQTCGDLGCALDLTKKRGAGRLLIARWTALQSGLLGIGSKCALSIKLHSVSGDTELADTQEGKCNRKGFDRALRSFGDRLSSWRRDQDQNAQMSKTYKGCGKTEEEAKRTLASNIATEIEAVSEIRETGGTGGGEVHVKAKVSVQTHVPLSGLDWERGPGQVCAVQAHGNLKKVVLARLEWIQRCDQDLPDDQKARSDLLEKCRTDIRMVRSLYPLFLGGMTAAQRAKRQKLEALGKRVDAMASKLMLQSVRFNVSTPGAVIRVGSEVIPKQRKVPRPAGPLRYSIAAPGHCTIEEEIELKPNEERVITPSFSKYVLPRLLFKTEQKNISLEVDGKTAPFEKPLTIARCTGVVAYRANAVGGDPETGEIKLRPGLDRTIEITVLTASDRTYLRQLAGSFEQRSLLVGKYGIAVPLNGSVDTSPLHAFRAEYTFAYHALRYGFGASYGFAKGDAHLVEGYGRLMGQLVSFGGDPLRIGSSVVIIPFLAIDLGLGYHGLVSSETGNRGKFGNFAENYIIARGSAGVLFGLNDFFGITVEAAYNLTMEQPLSFGAGAMVSL